MIKEYVNNLYDNFYKSSPTGGGYKSLFPSTRISAEVTSSSPLTFRSRTGHCGLNKHRHRINLYSSGLCSIYSVSENVEHVLFHCPQYSNARDIHRSNLTKSKAEFSRLYFLIYLSLIYRTSSIQQKFLYNIIFA